MLARPHFDNYIRVVVGIVSERANSKLYLLPLGSLHRHELGEAIARIANPAVALYDNDHAAFPLVFDPGVAWPEGSAAVPLGYASADARWRRNNAAKNRRNGRSGIRGTRHDQILRAQTRKQDHDHARTPVPGEMVGPASGGTHASTRNLPRERRRGTSSGWKCVPSLSSPLF